MNFDYPRHSIEKTRVHPNQFTPRKLLFFLGVLGMLGVFSNGIVFASVPLDANGRELFFDGQVVVEFDPSVTPAQQEAVVQRLGYSIIKKAPIIHAIVLKVPNGKVLEYVESLKQNSWFKKVYPNYKFYLLSYTPYSYPNDPNYQNGNDEWNVNQVHMDQAWNDSDPWIATASRGRPSAKIGIIDTGIRASHEDFVGKIDPNSYNFIDNNTDLTDMDGHGTSVAGIASVATNNNKGGGGICANCTLIITVAGHGGTLDAVASFQGANWAVNHGAKAINCSFGSGPGGFLGASNYAWSNGAIIVGGMGNDGNNTEYSPASDGVAIGVGAITSSGNRCNFSNYGSWIGLVVPVCGPSGLITDGGVFGPSFNTDTSYGLRTGTSAACPQVAAVAAILIDLGLTPAQCRQNLFTTADDLGTVGFDEYTGWGQMNAWRALAAARPASSLNATSGLNQISFNWIAPQTTAFPTTNYIISRSDTPGGPYTYVGQTPDGITLNYTDTSPNPNLTYYYIVQAVDAKGNTTVPSNEVSAMATGSTWTATPTTTPTPDYGEYTNWTFTGFWHAVNDGISPCANSYSSPWAVYYGVDSTCTYATGSPTTGILTPSTAYIICSPTDSLNFNAWWESDGGDTLTVQWSLTGNSDWNDLWTTSTTTSNGWIQENISLAPVTFSPFSIRFVVTTDGSANNSRGWYIDDVTVYNCLNHSPTPTITPTQTFTPTLSRTFTNTFTPSLTRTFTLTRTFSPSPTMTATLTPSFSPTSTPTLCMVSNTPCIPTPTPTPTLDPSTLVHIYVPYPNPAKQDQVTFYYQLSLPAEKIHFKLYTTAFRLVAEFDGTTQAGVNEVVYNISNLANGLYYYVAETVLGSKTERKIGKLIIAR